MRVWSGILTQSLISLCFLSASTLAVGLNLETLQNAFKNQNQGLLRAEHKKCSNGLIRENRLDFTFSAEALSRGCMQMNVTKYEKNKTSASDPYRYDWFYEHRDWDIDGIYQKFEDQEGGGKAYMTLGKSVFVYKGKSTAEFFNDASLMSREFQEAACNGSEVLEIGQNWLTTRRNVTLVGDFNSTVHFHIYNDLKSFLWNEVPPSLRDSWVKSAGEVKLELKKITTSFSAKDEIIPSDYSAGGRTSNFYYDIDGKNTLHVSYKVVSFRNVRNLGFLGVHQKTIDSQYDGTFESLKKIAALITVKF